MNNTRLFFGGGSSSSIPFKLKKRNTKGSHKKVYQLRKFPKRWEGVNLKTYFFEKYIKEFSLTIIDIIAFTMFLFF